MSLSFFCPAFNKNATEHLVRTIREFYPENKIIISSDKGPNYYDIANKYNCTFFYYDKNIGYPIQPYGFSKEKMKEWLDRFYIACIESKTSHIMMAEDDITIISKIEIETDIELFGHNTTPNIIYGNKIPYQIIDYIKELTKITPNVDFYGAGGGTVFNVDTFIKNYFVVSEILVDMVERFPFYPTIGWLDCFMTIFYLLCGKSYTPNHKLYEIPFETKNFDISAIDNKKYSIIHKFKNYYE